MNNSCNSQTSNRNKIITPGAWNITPPLTKSVFFEEPLLVFANEETTYDPKVGIPLYGPRFKNTSRHRSEIHVAMIGRPEDCENVKNGIQKWAEGVDGSNDQTPFPGFSSDHTFHASLIFEESKSGLITRQEEREFMETKRKKEGFEKLLQIVEFKLKALFEERDNPPSIVFFVVGEEMFKAYNAIKFMSGRRLYSRNLRRAFKVLAMKYKATSQILRPSTFLNDSKVRRTDHPSRSAWNLFTGIYYKASGPAWTPAMVDSNVCHVGISFYRPSDSNNQLRTSIAQAFDETGEGIILRGNSFHWDEKAQGKSPHLSRDQASALLNQVIEQFKIHHSGQIPSHIIVHKSSRFEPEERIGFEDAIRGKVNKYDLVALQTTGNVRLVRQGKYPPARGTSFTIGDNHYLYTRGYLPTERTYPHAHVPSPLQIADHTGDSSVSEILQSMMVLTKLNQNTADFCGLLPITLRFSRLVADILREANYDDIIRPQFKYYI